MCPQLGLLGGFCFAQPGSASRVLSQTCKHIFPTNGAHQDFRAHCDCVLINGGNFRGEKDYAHAGCLSLEDHFWLLKVPVGELKFLQPQLWFILRRTWCQKLISVVLRFSFYGWIQTGLQDLISVDFDSIRFPLPVRDMLHIQRSVEIVVAELPGWLLKGSLRETWNVVSGAWMQFDDLVEALENSFFGRFLLCCEISQEVLSDRFHVHVVFETFQALFSCYLPHSPSKYGM